MSIDRTSANLLVALSLGLACLLTGCADAVPSGGPYVWIDAPADGLRVDVGQPVQIEGHASYREGVARVETWVNGEPHLSEDNPPAEGSLSRFEHSWTPPVPGEYTIQVVAIGADGSSSQPDSVRLHVGEEVAEVTPTFTITPAESDGPATATPTSPPPPTVTLPPLPPTATATVPPPPTATPTPTPADTTAPPAPATLKPLEGVELDCFASLMLRWSPVSDPSGIRGYRVQVERSSDGLNWESHDDSPWGGLTAPELEIEVECGWYYRWRVRAVDRAGNAGPFSAWSEFTVVLI